jgi:[ribosomal protein S5]-alanine N-acetyltransferase
MTLPIDERDIFIRGTTIMLKALSERDVQESGWYGWFNDAAATEFVQQRYFPNTLERQLEFYRTGIAASTTKIQLGILPTGANAIVGVVSLSGIDWMNRKAEFGIMIGEASARGKGYGTEACLLLVQHGFERLSLNKIYLGVHAAHTAAIRSYEKAGFRIDGVLRDDVLLNGVYADTVQMSMLAREFYALSANISANNPATNPSPTL